MNDLTSREADLQREASQRPSRPAAFEQPGSDGDARDVDVGTANGDIDFRAIAEYSPDIVTRIDRDLRYVYVNPAITRVGGSPAEVLGKTIRDLDTPEELADERDAVVRHVFETGEERIIERELMTRQGPRHFQIRYVPEHDVEGSVAYVLSFARDITDRVRAERALRFLTDASTRLAGSLDYEETLAEVAQLAVSAIADWCVVDVADGQGQLRRLAIAHRDPEKVALAWELVHRYPPKRLSSGAPSRAMRTGRPVLLKAVTDDLLQRFARDPDHLRMLRDLGVSSYLSVPLSARGRVFGVLTLVSADSGRRFDDRDLALAVDLARHAALAIDNARLYRESQQATREHDQAYAILDSLLSNAPIAIAFHDRELRFVRINERMADINGRSITEHLGRRVSEVLPELGPAIEVQLRNVIETGEPIVGQEVSGETPAEPGRLRHWLVNHYPVRTRDGEIVGVGAVVLDISERRRVEEELVVRARQQAAVAQLGQQALAGAQIDDLLDSAVRVVAETLDVEYAKVLELLPDGHELVLRAGIGWHEGLVGAATVGAGLDSQAGYTLSVRAPVVVDDLRSETRFSGPPLLHEHGVVSGMSVIIAGEVEPFGVLGAHTTWRRAFSSDDVNFLQAVANVLAAAIERSRLFAIEQETRRAAEAAVRLREEFLSIASHELKTPLTSIKASAQLVSRRLLVEQFDRSRVTKLMGQLEHEIDRLALLVSDLLDASRIQRGRLELRREWVDLTELARQVLERFEHAPERKGHRLDLEAPEPVDGEWDAARLDQVLTNLVSNALKYSSEGGRVSVSIRRVGNEAEVAVRDEGLGIPEDELALLFRPFVRGAIARQSVGGTGLGLYIASQIIERHGGSIAVESEPGRGSTFTVRLPLSMDQPAETEA